MATSKTIKLADLFDSNNFIKASKISNTQMLLNIQNGEFDNKKTWCVKDDDGEEYLLLPHSALKKVLRAIEGINEEKLILELGRDVIQSAPIDFDDVMAVAIDKIEAKRLNDGSLPPHINTKSIVSEIKKSHPNLFFNFNENFLRRGLL